MRPDWFLGIDLGTGSCKSTIIDDNARILGFGASGYRADSSEDTWQELNLESLVDAMVASVRLAIERAGAIPSHCRAFSITGIYHSLAVVDRSGNPLTNLMTWVDERPAAQAQAVREKSLSADLYYRTGCPVHALYPLCKLIWLHQERPHIFKQARRFISGKEYVLWRLTGEYLLDYGIAAGTGLLNTHDLVWDDLAMELAGVSPGQLSPLLDPRHIIRGIDAGLAKAMGIPADTPLVLGSADAVNSSMGTGAVLPNQATCMIGTSGAVRIIARQPLLDSQGRTFCYAIDHVHWLVGGAINNAGLALTWLRRALSPIFKDTPLDMQFETLLQLAGQASAGAEGLICLPFFAGERSPYWNMHASGAFFGLRLKHDFRHMARALLEGIAFRLRSVNDVLVELSGGIDQIRAAGGFTQSDLWLGIVASVMDHELQVLEWGESSSLGAAFWALLGAGVIRDIEELDRLVKVEKRIPPNEEEARLYARMFKIYLDTYSKMGDTFEHLSALSSD